MKRIIRLTEKNLAKIVKRILKEDNDPRSPEMPEIPPQEYLDLIASADTEKEMGDDIVKQQVTEYWNKSKNLSRLVRRALMEQPDSSVIKLRKCYVNFGIPFPDTCEKSIDGYGCQTKIGLDATNAASGYNKGGIKTQKFWGCIIDIDETILQGMG
jgi:hypothetical protein